MAAFAAGIFNQAASAAQTIDANKPQSASAAATPQTTSGSGSSSASVSANDFLTLLVTEMKNQDPTANTDPNEYINQLVNVNSLQQLISINQTLSSSLGSPSAGSRNAASSHSVQVTNSAGQFPLSSGAGSTNPTVSKAVGNLTVPGVLPSAQALAQALGGQPRG